MLSFRGRILVILAIYKSHVRDWFATFYFDFTSYKYSNIQYMTSKLKPSPYCTTFTRYYFFSKFWTPVMYKINPATIDIKRPVKLGRRWGGDAWLKKQW